MLPKIQWRFAWLKNVAYILQPKSYNDDDNDDTDVCCIPSVYYDFDNSCDDNKDEEENVDDENEKEDKEEDSDEENYGDKADKIKLI